MIISNPATGRTTTLDVSTWTHEAVQVVAESFTSNGLTVVTR